MSFKTTSKRIARRSAHLLGLLVLLAIVVPFVIYAVPGVVGADHSFVVLSGSMEPTASPGDAIIVEEINPAKIEAGDVIAFQKSRDGVPTTHRVVTVTGSDSGLAFITKGDANEDTDPAAVPASRVVGRVMTVEGHLFVIPYVGHVILFIGTPVGFATLVGLPLGLLVLTELWSFVRSTRTDDPSTTKDADDAGQTVDAHDTVRTAAGSTDLETETRPVTVERPESDGDTAGGITISRGEIALVVPVLAAFAAYSIWTVSHVFTALTIAVAVASGLLFLLAAFLYVGAGWSSDPAPVTSTAQASIEVDSVEDLLAMARAGSREVAWDGERERYHTVGGPVSFVYDGDRAPGLDVGGESDPVADGDVGHDPMGRFFETGTHHPRMTADGGKEENHEH
ncbi:MAG TPA: signal peptidase I [Natrialbaceae archaeon]|nr:signal peptidase I [Natrialbaceae archaeon]